MGMATVSEIQRAFQLPRSHFTFAVFLTHRAPGPSEPNPKQQQQDLRSSENPRAHLGAGLKQLLRGIWANAPWEPVAVITRAPPPSASASKPVDADAASPSETKKAQTREHGTPLVLVPLGTTQERTLSALCAPPQLPPRSSSRAEKAPEPRSTAPKQM